MSLKRSHEVDPSPHATLPSADHTACPCTVGHGHTVVFIVLPLAVARQVPKLLTPNEKEKRFSDLIVDFRLPDCTMNERSWGLGWGICGWLFVFASRQQLDTSQAPAAKKRHPESSRQPQNELPSHQRRNLHNCRIVRF